MKRQTPDEQQPNFALYCLYCGRGLNPQLAFDIHYYCHNCISAKFAAQLYHRRSPFYPLTYPRGFPKYE